MVLLKGGVGKSTLSAGLAGAYCGPLKRSTLLIDLDLQFGDVGIMMGIDPTQTIVDLVTTTGELDPDKLERLRRPPPLGDGRPRAPLRPEDAELVTEDRIGQLIDVAKSAYDIVVLDTPPHFDATTLAALDRSDRLVLVTTMDIPTVKNRKLALQTLNLLQYPRERIALVVNRPLRRADLRRATSRARSTCRSRPSSRSTRRSAPPSTAASRSPISAPRSAAAKAMRELAESCCRQAPRPHVQGRQRRGQGTEAQRPAASFRRPPERPEGGHVQVLQVEGQEGGVN